MPRRAVRSAGAELDLSQHFLLLPQLTAPLDWSVMFAQSSAGPTGPIEIELGSGKGLFLSQFSQRHPERNYLGNELAFKYAKHAAERLAKAKQSNAVMIQGDGLRLFREFIPSSSVSAVHVYFPDPWWKSRHKKRRVLNAPLLRDVERVLIPGGELHFWTDVAEYYETTLALIAQTITLAGPFAVAEPVATHDLDYRTHFERRCRLHREPVYRSRYVKN